MGPTSLMTKILRGVPERCGIAPNDMTKQGLLDALVANSKGAVYNGRPFDYHFLAICVRELSNFMSDYDKQMAGSPHRHVRLLRVQRGEEGPRPAAS